jgi:hypothetical protein
MNKAIRRTKHPGKSIEDLICITNGAKFFSKLDIRKAFHQLLLAESSRNYTTITTHKGLYRYLRLHTGIASASEIFTEVLRTILEGLEGVINMIDDILTFGATRQKQHENLIAVMIRLEEAGITLNLEKCEFYVTELTFFGLLFSENGVSPTLDRVKALREAKPPATASELRSFLGAVQWCSRFIENMCTITQPLWKLTKTNVPWQWGQIEQDAFTKLKQSITSRCMAFFDKTWDIELVVDASPVGLSQC